MDALSGALAAGLAAWHNYAAYLVDELTQPRIRSFSLWLVLFSVFCFVLEVWRPWNVRQGVFRKDFGLDVFYMVFNVFLFPLVGFHALASGFEFLFTETLWFDAPAYFSTWPWIAHAALLFVIRDFVQWNIHRLLHWVPFLWKIHMTHHSAEELGFAAHLRFHPLETVLYRVLEYLPLFLLGYGAIDLFWVHVFALGVGHLNHTNTWVPLGPLRYVFNNPQMHRWHHVKDLPSGHGVNFGLTLSVWDYLFKTAYVPRDGRDEVLGVEDQGRFPKRFFGQLASPFRRAR